MKVVLTITLCFVVMAVVSTASTKERPFGHSLLADFMLAPNYVNFNHGSFGAPPRAVIEAQRAFVDTMEAKPDPWFRGGYQIIQEGVRERLGKYLNADSEDIVLVENASSGVNSVLRSLSSSVLRNKGVLFLSTAYAMVPNTLHYLSARENIRLHMLNITFPLANGAVEQMVEAELARNSDIALCVFSHVTSVPSFILPIANLSAICQRHGAAVLIDGAHALGQIPIDLSALARVGVNFYVGNAHKWLYSPKGSAFLWSSAETQKWIVPTVISSTGKNDFVGEYEYVGTRDYTAFCSIGAALDFRATFGEERIMNYLRSLAIWAGHYLADTWETEVLVPDELCGAMVNVRLPTDDATVASALSDRLLQDYDMYVVVYGLQGRFWTRLSAQIYLEQSDFIKLGEVIQNILQP